MTYQFIEPKKITEMLFNDAEYVIEFCEAGVSSFDEFISSYRTHLLERNIEDLRQAGHKIKPGAQMMGADEVVEEYENAKSLIRNKAEHEKLVNSVKRMQKICNTVQNELSRLANHHD